MAEVRNHNEVLQEFVLALRRDCPIVSRMVDLGDVPSTVCGYCGTIWDPWSVEHHTEGCVWSPRITEALTAGADAEEKSDG